jgi:dipeptidyl aminopeptidase/acylaminoacyl peptidase
LFVTDWSPDGLYIAFDRRDNDAAQDRDIGILPRSGSQEPFAFLETDFHEYGARFSPDGKWIAFVSDESGTHEIYVQPFPATGAKWRISPAGGIQPRWRGYGSELFYLTPEGALMGAPLQIGGRFQVGESATLFTFRTVGGSFRIGDYAVTPDGQRFLVNQGQEPAVDPLTVVLNWTATLRTR